MKNIIFHVSMRLSCIKEKFLQNSKWCVVTSFYNHSQRNLMFILPNKNFRRDYYEK